MTNDGISDRETFKAYQFQKEREIDKLRLELAAQTKRAEYLFALSQEHIGEKAALSERVSFYEKQNYGKTIVELCAEKDRLSERVSALSRANQEILIDAKCDRMTAANLQEENSRLRTLTSVLSEALKTAQYDLERIMTADWTAEQMRMGAKSGAFIVRQVLAATARQDPAVATQVDGESRKGPAEGADLGAKGAPASPSLTQQESPKDFEKDPRIVAQEIAEMKATGRYARGMEAARAIGLKVDEELQRCLMCGFAVPKGLGAFCGDTCYQANMASTGPFPYGKQSQHATEPGVFENERDYQLAASGQSEPATNATAEYMRNNPPPIPPKPSPGYCTCGHLKEAHIYGEGACRPGFVCQDHCPSFYGGEDE